MALGIGEKLLCTLALVLFHFCYFSFSTAAIISILLVIAVFLKLNAANRQWRRQGISGPEPNFFLGSYFQLKNGVKHFDIENTKKYGKIFSTSFLSFPVLMVSDFDMLKEILVKKFDCFINRAVVNKIVGNNERSIRSKFLFILQDTLWKDVRNTVTPSFTTGKMKQIMPILGDCIEETLVAIEKAVKNDAGFFDVKKVCGNLTMDAIARCAFGVDIGAQREQQESDFVKFARKVFSFTFRDLRIVFITMFPNVARMLENLGGFEFLNGDANQFFINATRNVIEQRRLNPTQMKKPDFLQLLLNSLESEGNDESETDEDITFKEISSTGRKVHLSEELIIAQSLTFLTAGFETSATTLQFCLYHLATHPDVQKIAYREVKNVLEDKDFIEYDDLCKMTYIEQIMLETLRMCPPAPRLIRECNKDVVINDIFFKTGSIVAVPIYAVHYCEDDYPNPERFDPDRFSPEERAKRSPLSFLPFGYGPRNCIGMRFAQLEIRMALAQCVRKFQFSINEKTEKPPLKLNTVGFTRPMNPIFLTATLRH